MTNGSAWGALILTAALISLAGPADAGQDSGQDSGPPEPQSEAEVLQVLRSQGLVGVWSVNG